MENRTECPIIQLKSPITLKLGTNAGFGDKLEKMDQKFYFFQVRSPIAEMIIRHKVMRI